jgi:hypothetical protein
MHNSEPNIYGGLCTIRNGYMQMQWSRAQMYLVSHTIALPVMFNANMDEEVKFVLSFGKSISSLSDMARKRLA